MFSVLATKLPPFVTKIIVVIGLCGMMLGFLVCFWNGNYDLGWSVFYASSIGFLFAASAKYIIVKCMRAWMEGKLEEVAREREATRTKIEELKVAEEAAAAAAKAAQPVAPAKAKE